MHFPPHYCFFAGFFRHENASRRRGAPQTQENACVLHKACAHSLFGIGMEEQVSLFVWADILCAFSFLYMCVRACVHLCEAVKERCDSILTSKGS